MPDGWPRLVSERREVTCGAGVWLGRALGWAARRSGRGRWPTLEAGRRDGLAQRNAGAGKERKADWVKSRERRREEEKSIFPFSNIFSKANLKCKFKTI